MSLPKTTLQSGVEFRIKWEFRNDDDTVKDLTGFTVLVQIRETECSEDYIVSYDQDSTQITFDEIGGIVELLIPSSETSDISFSSGVIDCYVTDGVDGERTPEVIVAFDKGVSNPDD